MCLCLMSGSLLGWFISQRLKMCRVLWWFVFFLFFLQVLSNYIGVRGKQNPCEILFCCKIAWKPECRRLSLTWKTLKRCMLTLSTLFLFWEISLSRISKCVLFFFFFFQKVPIRLLWRNCTLTEPREKPEPWNATRFLSHTKMPWMGVHRTTSLLNYPQGIFPNLPHSPWAIIGPIRAFGTPLWLHAKDTTSISRQWAVWRRWASSEILLFHWPEEKLLLNFINTQ